MSKVGPIKEKVKITHKITSGDFSRQACEQPPKGASAGESEAEQGSEETIDILNHLTKAVQLTSKDSDR